MAKRISEHAAAAKMIRAELKKHGIKASVRAKSYTGGSSITVSLNNVAPWTKDAIDTYCAKFEMGSFNAMEDIYEYDNSRDDIPQVKFVFIENEFDDDMKEKAYRFLRDHMAGYEDKPDHYVDAANLMGSRDWVSSEVYRVLSGYFDDHSFELKFWNKPRVKCAA